MGQKSQNEGTCLGDTEMEKDAEPEEPTTEPTAEVSHITHIVMSS